MLPERDGKQSVKLGILHGRLKINNKLYATTYEGGGGEDSRRCDFKAAGLVFAVRAAVPVLEAN